MQSPPKCVLRSTQYMGEMSGGEGGGGGSGGANGGGGGGSKSHGMSDMVTSVEHLSVRMPSGGQLLFSWLMSPVAQQWFLQPSYATVPSSSTS